MDLEKETPQISPHRPEISDDINKTPQRPAISWENIPQTWAAEDSATGFHQGPRSRRRGAKLIIWSWFAALIDSFVLVGMSLIFLVSFLFVMKSSWVGFVSQGAEFFVLAGVSIFVVFSFFYMIMLRSVLGYTLGDWACDLRLGSQLQRQSSFYSFRVLLRSLFLMVTGVILLPLLSLLLRKDLAGSLSGVRIYSLK